ncbi:MAG: hypothetical protein ACRDJE_28505, partial [Dehalococcoidia bacterium]
MELIKDLATPARLIEVGLGSAKQCVSQGRRHQDVRIQDGPSGHAQYGLTFLLELWEPGDNRGLLVRSTIGWDGGRSVEPELVAELRQLAEGCSAFPVTALLVGEH